MPYSAASKETRSRVNALTERLLFEFIALAIEAILPVPGDALTEMQYQACLLSSKVHLELCLCLVFCQGA